MTKQYQVIIVGGGPVGTALAIELGMHNIDTLVLEKYSEPLLSPRAQSLNTRSMEFMQRWQTAGQLKAKRVLPEEYANQGIWCSKLNGVTYAGVNANNQLINKSFEKGIRIPLWITEEVLREKLQEYKSVIFLKNQQVTAVIANDKTVLATSENRRTKQQQQFQAHYVIACDGANSITRTSAGIGFSPLAENRRVLNVMFEAQELAEQITVGKGFIYYLLDNAFPSVIGAIDLQRGLWYAQIVCQHEEKAISDINIDQLLEEVTGVHFQKTIIDAHFWDMQIQIAQQFSAHNRIFLVGDSAHAFAPTGGFGLNTGFGDVTNLAWKLTAVIKGHASSELLTTYEQERRPICLNNLHAAEKNASAMVNVRKEFPPEKDKQAFANANAKIAKQHAHAAGLTMGYAYFDSPLTVLQTDQSTIDMPASDYTPTAKPGYFLPYVQLNDQQSIYEKLSPIRWTLIICGEDINFSANDFMDILQLPDKTYPYRYLLVRPDWHIAYAGETFTEAFLKEYFTAIFSVRS